MFGLMGERGVGLRIQCPDQISGKLGTVLFQLISNLFINIRIFKDFLFNLILIYLRLNLNTLHELAYVFIQLGSIKTTF